MTYISNINNEEVRIAGQRVPALAAMVDGFNKERNTVGTIRVGLNSFKALLPFVEPSEMVNTAVLNGKKVSTRISLLAVKASGDRVLLPSANCHSLSRALHVTDNCSDVWLNGSEPQGSAAAVIQVRYEKLTANVSVRVWYPALPVHLSVENPELAEISGWLAPEGLQNSCSRKHQWTQIQARANFSYDGLQFEEISVTDLVSALLKSSDCSVAYIMNSGEVFGKSPGQVTVTALNPVTANIIGSVDITVSNNRRVFVQSLDIALVTNLSISMSSTPFDKLSTQTAEVSVGQDLHLDHSRSSVLVFATFSDGTRQEINQKLGLRLTSLNKHVLQVANKSEVLSVGSGTGILKAEWYLRASSCHPRGFLLGVGYDVIEVYLYPPVRVVITGVSPQISVAGDRSTTAEIPTSSGITIGLLFQNDHYIDMTADSRTILDLSESEGFFYIERDSQNRPVIYANTEKKFGKKLLMVKFTHFEITGSVMVNVVAFLGFALHLKPFPPYPDSDKVFMKTLNPVAGTTSYEMASLCLSMVMTDGSLYDVTYHELTSFSSKSQNLIVGSKASNRVNIVKDATPSKFNKVVGHFGSLGSELVVEIGTTPVRVTAIGNLSLVPENNWSLSGVQDSHVARVTFSLLFDNQKQVLEFYQSGQSLFPGLVTLTSENQQVFSLDSDTGQVTLRRNYYRKLALTATAAMVTAQINVTCNLKPKLWDVDLGAESGIPLTSQLVGTSFEVPVRLNAEHSEGTTSMDLVLNYDRRYLLAASVKGLEVWTNLWTNLNDPGKIIINGVSDSAVKGTQEVAVITFNATAPGIASIVGSVATQFAPEDSVVAGMLLQEVLSRGSRRRRSVHWENESLREGNTRRARRSNPCSLPPCECSGVHKPGDLNKDCIFDISDVLFVLNYYTRSLVNSSSPGSERMAIPKSLDVDRNSVVNPADAYFLVRASLDLVRFVLSASVIPVQDWTSDCKLSLNVTMATTDAPAKPANTFVFFDITYRGSGVEFAGSAASRRGSSIYGNVIRASSVGNGVYSVSSSIELVRNTIGVNIYQVTTSADNRTSILRSYPFLGNPEPPHLFPVKFSVDLQVLGQRVSMETGSFNPLIVFNNTLASSACNNNFAPVFTSNTYFANVSENVHVNTTVLTVNATDQDSGKSGEIRYSLVLHEHVPFIVEPATGVISTNGSIDREQRDLYNLTVRATDRALGRERYTHAHVAVVVTDVNDERPSFERDTYTLGLDEGSYSGLVFHKLRAKDSDKGSNSELTYSIMSGNESVFTINRTSGEMSVVTAVDYESVRQLNLTVHAKDHGKPSLETSVSIIVNIRDVNDNAPVVEPVGSLLLREDVAIGSYVVTVNATDADSGLNSELAFSITSGNTGNAFFINSTTGVIATAAALDYEANKVFHLNISVRDRGSPSLTTTTVIQVLLFDLNDVIPVILPVSRVYVRENVPTGTVIVRLRASDADTGANALLRFSIVKGERLPICACARLLISVVLQSRTQNLLTSYGACSTKTKGSGKDWF